MTEGFGKAVKIIFSGLLLLVGGTIGAQVAQMLYPLIPERWFSAGTLWLPMWLPGKILITTLSVSLFSLIGLLLTPLFLRLLGFLGSLLERHLTNTSWGEIASATVGMVVGLLVANLIAMPLAGLPFSSYLAVVLNLVCGYLGARTMMRRQNDLKHVLAPIHGLRERLAGARGQSVKGRSAEAPYPEEGAWCAKKKVLDTSVIIDGRVLDIAKTGFLEGLIIIPRFVLLELQAVADSTDPARRTRGRRGLDVASQLQRVPSLDIEIGDVQLKDLKVDSVDSGLLALAEKIDAQILTTDYNLNKMAQIQSIQVLNVNDLANALKPVLLPGETIVIDIIREGKEANQGVGYLDDGTMFVVEDGEWAVGKRVEVVVTSMLQTSAGRMVFGRIKREVRS